MKSMQKSLNLNICSSVFQPPGFNFDMESLNLPGGPGAGEQCSIM